MPSTSDPRLRYEVALAGRIMAYEGQSDAIMGFVGARASDGRSFWMKPMTMGMDEVYPGDLLRIDYEGKVVEGEGKPHNEWVFFAAIFRDYPRHAAAVHTHARYSLALAACGMTVEPFDQFGTFFHAHGAPVFQGSPERVYTFELAREIMDCLGDAPAVIMNYHGILSVGENMRDATMRAVFLERAAQTQLFTYQSGGARPMNEELARKLGLNAPYALINAFYWDYFERRIRAKDAKLTP